QSTFSISTTTVRAKPRPDAPTPTTIRSRTKTTKPTPAGIFTQIKPQIGGRRNKPNRRPARDNKSRIILDSGASAHIFKDKQFFSQITKGDFEVIKTGKENATLPVKGKGSVRLKWGNRAIQLEDCLYVPDIVINLVSAGALDRKRCQIHSESGNFYTIQLTLAQPTKRRTTHQMEI
ncbi:hypothetical protein VP01_8209g1, partial [Puccinia sorghi]